MLVTPNRHYTLSAHVSIGYAGQRRAKSVSRQHMATVGVRINLFRTVCHNCVNPYERAPPCAVRCANHRDTAHDAGCMPLLAREHSMEQHKTTHCVRSNVLHDGTPILLLTYL